jgi:hypothetical protein
MKIAVFGDSFAEKKSTHSWWRFLQSDHGHEVSCFGESGSSLSYSTDLIQEYAQNHDWIIWCMTSVNRISFWYKDKIWHNTGTSKPEITGDQELDHKRHIIYHYITDCFDWHFQEMLGHSLMHYMLNRYPNLTIIPCFPTPVYYMQKPQFNLWEICKLETLSVHPEIDPYQYVNTWQDHRRSHLTQINHRILANLISYNLMPGIFVAEYTKFQFDPLLLKKEIL